MEMISYAAVRGEGSVLTRLISSISPESIASTNSCCYQAVYHSDSFTSDIVKEEHR